MSRDAAPPRQFRSRHHHHERNGFTQDHSQNLRRQRTQRHTQPNLYGAANYRVRHEAVETDTCEHQCKHTEET
jgi:hypothetical protein